ncbi:MAG: hypothetical protein HY517_01395 [Candidatus Aenigmarchaeota archaeon]|nr:hypothetical protein [Candidatus Aenigmarchaeota archaeon]MBI4174272.1 hypothetical protein [Candidatus Aenigmarchaeota archaeon]
MAFLKRFIQKACYCERCGRTEMYDIGKKPSCKFCGSHVKPTKRPV